MNFEELMAGYVGRTVEVFLTNEFFTGQLAFVGSGYITVNVAQGYYTAVLTNILIGQIEYVRVLPQPQLD
ncbi:hypothetical protein ACFFK0_23050 [Paenibacillus chartarius]|uniref:DUF2642 domain-containing protein n=1 Tax=Paenibacillus chartarius TaxID=747481 RepID=A0ABV6DRL5_9BACL